MATFSLLAKDVREHRLAALLLALGSLVVVLMLLERNAVAAYSMSPFEIVRFALLSFIPLVALIIGNRLIVREYLSGTRLFVEALPVGSSRPLLLKYLLGLVYLSCIALAMVLLAAQQAGMADDVTRDYLLLICSKTLVMAMLYWSVVFCFSLCGHLRLALYLLVAALVALIAWYPGIDPERFAPFALMDDQLFVFERDVIPWRDMAATLLIALAFTLVGFLLVRLGEGSVVERLAKPMTRRDYVALGVLGASGLAVWSTLLDKNQRDPIEFSSESVVRLSDPDVSVLYLEEAHHDSAMQLARRTHESLSTLQSSLGLVELPHVRLSLAPGREPDDMDYSTVDGVFISANWLENDSYHNAVLDSVILHGVLSSQTDGRAMFEPYHWILDGFTRWWVEQGSGPVDPVHQGELVARASWALDSDPDVARLVDRWQLTADRFAYPTAESLAWAAMAYLEQTQGRGKVLALANEFLITPVGSNLIASIRDRRVDIRHRLEAVLDMPLPEFRDGWRQWLQEQKDGSQAQFFLEHIPALRGRVVSRMTDDGAQELVAYYERRASVLPLDENIESLPGKCILKHDYIGPFDTEFEVTDDYEDVRQCQLDTVVHVIDSLYSRGDRVFVALDYEGSELHQPLRLHAERMTVE